MAQTIHPRSVLSRLLQPTLKQNYDNPLQRDRLPDTNGVELEFPAACGTPSEHARTTRWFILLSMVLSLLVALLVQYTGIIVSPWFTGIIAAAGAFLVLSSWRRIKQIQGFVTQILILPVAGCVFLSAHPIMLLGLLSLLMLATADLFATHYIHLQTTAPMDRQTAMTLRSIWKRRFGIGHAISGAELYALAMSVLVLLPAVFVWWIFEDPPFWGSDYIPRFLLIIAGFMLVPFFFEVTACFLFARQMVSFRSMAKSMFSALSLWLNYDKDDLEAPGVYKTPAGPCSLRRRMALGLVLLTSSTVAMYMSPAVISRHMAIFREHHWRPGDTPHGTEQAEFQKTGPAKVEPLSQNAKPPVIEPYQQKMLDRMPADRRQGYLDRLRRPEILDTESDPTTPKSDGAPQLNIGPRIASRLAEMQPREYFSAEARFLVVGMVLLHPVAASLLTTSFLLSAMFVTTGRLSAQFGNRDQTFKDIFSADNWDQLVARVQSSKDIDERNSLLLGVNAIDDSPVLVPRKVFTEHAHLLGDSGSGKTSIGIASIVSQLMRPGDCSIVILDLKGDDLAMFEGIRRDAKEAGLRFRWFTNQLERSTYAFNPLGQPFLERMTVYQKTDLLTTSMGLQYGRDYGRAYYSDANARMLHSALAEYPRVESFRQLAGILGESAELPGVDSQLRQAAAHLTAVVDRLADAEAVNVTSQAGYDSTIVDNAVDFMDVVRDPQVVHFHLTSTIGATSSAEIARVALYSLVTAATMIPPEQRRQTFVVIDEFQRIVAGNIELLLQLARSLNIGIILANQSLMDLQTAGTDLIPAISANTRYRQIFAASNLEEQERVVRGSGESVTYQQSLTETFIAYGLKSLNEYITPRLRLNDVLLATDHPLQSIVQIRRGAGYAQYGGMPFVMRGTHHITQDEYEDRKKATWPEDNGETLVPQLVDYDPRQQAVPTLLSQSRKENLFVDAPAESTSSRSFLERLYQEQTARHSATHSQASKPISDEPTEGSASNE